MTIFFQVHPDSSTSAVDFDGFILVMNNYYKRDFAKIDVDSSGHITVDEFLDRMDKEVDEAMCFSNDMKKSLIKEMFGFIDSDGNGELNFDEFVKFSQKFSV